MAPRQVFRVGILGLALAASIAGCTSILGDFTNASASPVDSGAIEFPDGGTDLPHDAAPPLPDGSCTPGAKMCQGQSDVLQCATNGTWQRYVTCPALCTNGTCTGECLPQTKKCVGNSFYTCAADGTWGTAVPCSIGCIPSTDMGCTSCIPGDKRCDSTTQALQTCTDKGEWATTTTCLFVCTGTGAGAACTGNCKPGDRQCKDSQPQACVGGALTDDGAPCAATCSGAGVCTGICATGDLKCSGIKVQSCSNGTWSDSKTCDYVCQGGACTGVCSPGTTQCIGNAMQTCGTDGQYMGLEACPFVCSGTACGGICKPGAKRCNGNTAQQCQTLGTGWGSDAICSLPCDSTTGLCGVCTFGTKQCLSHKSQTCNQHNQWADDGTTC